MLLNSLVKVGAFFVERLSKGDVSAEKVKKFYFLAHSILKILPKKVRTFFKIGVIRGLFFAIEK